MPEGAGEEYLKPEARARVEIDRQLRDAGWVIQDHKNMAIGAATGVAVREFPLAKGAGYIDYLLYVDGHAVGVLEAKKAGSSLTGVELQSGRYADSLPGAVPAYRRPLPFAYESTGIETRFTNLLDPKPRSREVHTFHRPEHLLELLDAQARSQASPPEGPGTFRRGLQSLPELSRRGLRDAQFDAINAVEESLAADRPRALIQMATGAGKTYTAAALTYRLLAHAGAKRVLFLVDRGNLGRQTLREFETFRSPDTGRLFTELYNVQHLSSNTIGEHSHVVITTIQRLHSMLSGETDLDPELEETSLDEAGEPVLRQVGYNPAIPIETFDAIVVDECHRSIYGVWRQVLDYFDAHLIGLTATPNKNTFGFFGQNLVFSYTHEQAVADRVNVDFDIYRIRTRVGEQGAVVEADGETMLTFRDRLTGRTRQAVLEEDFAYAPTELDRDVVAEDQLRTVIRTFRDKLFADIFPGRREVPKTLVFAKDDAHADRIVQMLREEFREDKDFAVKITYKTAKDAGRKPEDLLADFRNAYNPRIAVTVDMIATGTDVKPLECVFFLRSVKSRNFFEQMKGRGVRVINNADLQQVTPDAAAKTHFVIVDAVGVTETDLNETAPLDRADKSVPLDKLMQQAAQGTATADLASTLGSRLTRLARLADATAAADVQAVAGTSIESLAAQLISAVDPDRATEAAAQTRAAAGVTGDPTVEEIAAARDSLVKEALAPIRDNPELRQALARASNRRPAEQAIDEVTQDEVIAAGFSRDPADRARQTVADFRAFLDANRDEITAIQAVYEVPYKRRVTYDDVKELARAIERTPRSWTPEDVWSAYEQLDASRVRGHGGQVLSDLVSLLRFSLDRQDELVPYRSVVEERLSGWLLAQEQVGRTFTSEQQEWLRRIADIVAVDLEVTADALDEGEPARHGGLGKAYSVFGNDLHPLLDELNRELVA